MAEEFSYAKEVTQGKRRHWRNNKSYPKKEILFDAILQSPYKGIGKPEALKYQLSGKWSRRITSEHRFVYAVEENTLRIYSLKGHYK